MDELPIDAILLLVYITTWIGSVRLFLEEADQLFLIQKQPLYRALKRYGLLYSLLTRVISAMIPIGVFLPYFYDREFALPNLVMLFVLIACLNIATLLWKHYLFLTVSRKWLRILFHSLLFICGVTLFLNNALYLFRHLLSFFITLSLFFFFSLLLFQFIVKKRSDFEEDMIREHEAKWWIASLLMMQAGIGEKRLVKPRRRPWLFRSSNHLFRKRNVHIVILEVYLKAWIRKPENIFNYIRFLGIANAVIILFPRTWSILLTIVMMALFYHMNRTEWQSFQQSSFYKLLIRESLDVTATARRALLIISFPGFIVFSFFAGMLSFNITGAVLFCLLVFCFCLLSWRANQGEVT